MWGIKAGRFTLTPVVRVRLSCHQLVCRFKVAALSGGEEGDAGTCFVKTPESRPQGACSDK